MFCSYLWKMLYNQPKIPLKNCASCRGRVCPARSLPQYPFYGSIRRGGIYPSRTPSRHRRRPRRSEGWPPYTPTSNPCVGRGASTPPKPAVKSLSWFFRGALGMPPPAVVAAKSLSRFTRRGGIHPSRVVRPYCCTTQKSRGEHFVRPGGLTSSES